MINFVVFDGSGSPNSPEIRFSVCAERVTIDAEPCRATTLTLPKPEVSAPPPSTLVNKPDVTNALVGSVTLSRRLFGSSVSKATVIFPAPRAVTLSDILTASSIDACIPFAVSLAVRVARYSFPSYVNAIVSPADSCGWIPEKRKILDVTFTALISTDPERMRVLFPPSTAIEPVMTSLSPVSPPP